MTSKGGGSDPGLRDRIFYCDDIGKEVAKGSCEQDEGEGGCLRRKGQRQRNKHGLCHWSLGRGRNMVCWKGNKG